MSGAISLEQAGAPVREVWRQRHQDGALAVRSVEMYERLLDTFVSYATASGVTDLSGLTRRVCVAWVNAPVSAVSPGSRGRAGQDSASSTRRSRVVVLRQAARVWAEHGWVDPDLMKGVQVIKEPPLPPCPLTPLEAAQIRTAGRRTPIDTLLPAVVELALAGLSNTEIATLKVAAFDPDQACITVLGRGQSSTRIVELSASAVATIQTHLVALQRAATKAGTHYDPNKVPLALFAATRSVRDTVRPTVVGQHLYRAMKVAGIRRPGVMPGSLSEYAANRCYAITNRVEDVAALLGLKSLDAAMRIIDPAWQAAHGDTIRGHQD